MDVELTAGEALEHLAANVGLFPDGDQDPAYLAAVARVEAGELRFARRPSGEVVVVTPSPITPADA